MASASGGPSRLRPPKTRDADPADCRNLRGRCIAVAWTGRERDSGQAVALQTARTSRGPAGFTWRGATHVLPHGPPAVRVQVRLARSGVRAHKLQELLGGAYGEITVAIQYLFQGRNCRMPGKCKDLIMDIATEEMGHVEMIVTMVARLLEGAPATSTTKAAAADPVVGAVAYRTQRG